MSRIVVESGLEVNWSVDSGMHALLIGGTAAVAPAGLVALALSQCWLAGSAQLCLVNLSMQGEKIRSQFTLPRGLLVTALLAVALSTAVAMYSTARLAYNRGANNFGHWGYQWHMRIPYDQATDSIRGEKVGTDPGRLYWMGAGMGLYDASGIASRSVCWGRALNTPRALASDSCLRPARYPRMTSDLAANRLR